MYEPQTGNFTLLSKRIMTFLNSAARQSLMNISQIKTILYASHTLLLACEV